MENQKILSAINYLSVFFAPFIIPIIIYVAVRDAEVKRHAMRALLSHVIPIVLGIFLFIGLFMTGIFAANSSGNFIAGTWLLLMLGYGLVYLILIIWNIVQAVKVFR